MTTLKPVPFHAEATDPDAGFTLRCGDVDIDRPTRRLRRHGQPLALGDRAFDLLLALIDGRSQLQPAAALRAAVWPQRTVGDNNLRVQLTHLRRLLGDQAIRNQPGCGYELMAPVHDAATVRALAPPDAMHDALHGLHPGNLPETTWPVLGRADLLAELALRLQPGDRPTLVGPGGAGKTALALAAADHAAAGFAGGAWWVDLAPLRDSAQVPNAVAAAMQRAPAADQAMDRLVNALAGQGLLLVLDNCEHLRSAVAELSDRLLRAAPGVTLLATSRVPLCSAGEQLMNVPPLSLPAVAEAREGQREGRRAGPASEAVAVGAVAWEAAAWEAARASGAVAVFEARARASDPRFRVTPANAGMVVDICRQLDGHALALTLAAARVPVLGLSALHAGLHERLGWTQRAAPGSAAPQHLSLQGTLDWSYELLTAAEQGLLRRLGVFSGRFTLAAVAALAAVAPAATQPPIAKPGSSPSSTGVQRALESLVAHGLVGLDSAGLLGSGDAALYTLHESARLYAQERLESAGEADAARAALGRHLLDELRPAASRPGQPAAYDPARWRWLPDVQRLVEWATETDPALALALCSRAADTWRQAGQHALARRLSAPLLAQTHTAATTPARIQLLLDLCLLDYELEDTPSVLARTAQAQALLGEPDEASEPDRLAQYGLALSWQANVHARDEQLALAEALYAQALGLYRRAGDVRRVRETLGNLGWALQAQGKFDAARPALHEALKLSVQDGDVWGQMVSHENLGELELGLGAHAAAAAHFEREVVLARRRPEPFRLATAQLHLAFVFAARKAATQDGARALAAAHEALHISARHAFVRLQAEAGLALAAALVAVGRLHQAHAALCAAQTWRARHGVLAGRLHGRVEADVEQQTRSVLTAADCLRAQAQGELLTLDEALAWAAQRD